MDKFRIDSHKLMYHVPRVNGWLEGKNIYPLYVEIAASGACNHRCVYCALDFMEYKPRFLEAVLLKKRLKEMSRLGVKSIMYAGEGEPLLHKNIVDLINHTDEAGIDVALTTNGVLLTKNILDETLPKITWIKVSINAGTKETYSRIHRTNASDFNKVIENLHYAARLKHSQGYSCTLGMQLVLLPDNYREVVLLAKIAKDIGMDYLVVKPYSQHPFSRTIKYKNIKYTKYFKLADRLTAFNDRKFNVVFRIQTMKKWDEASRSYAHCHALPFWAYIDAGGNVWGCSAYLGDKRFLYGNIYDITFQKLWKGLKRKESIKRAENSLDIKSCRVNCRMDEINRYLGELRNPPEHVNFI